MSGVPDYPLGETIDFLFTSRAFATGVPTVLTSGTVVIYENEGLTPITAGVTLDPDFDGIVGLNRVRVVATGGNGYEAGKSYNAVLTVGTVGGTSVVGEVVASFSVERSPVNWANVTAPTTAVDLSGTDIQLCDTVTTTTTATTATNVTTVNGLAANVITAASIATAAIDADAIAADAIGSSELATTAVNEIRDAILSDSTAFNGADVGNILTDTAVIGALGAGLTDITDRLPTALTKGTADSGSTTTMVDAALTEADTDYWAGSWIRFTSGTITGQTRLITGFTPASDTVTFAPATTQAVGTNTYEIIPAGATGVDWGSVLRATTAVDLAATDIQLCDTITTYTDNTVQTGDSFARLGAPAGASVSADIAVVDGNVDTLITNVPDVISLAAINAEVDTALTTTTYAEPGQGTPAATASIEDKIGYLYKAWRNQVWTTADTISVYNDDASTVDHKATISDDATTFKKTEMVTGP